MITIRANKTKNKQGPFDFYYSGSNRSGKGMAERTGGNEDPDSSLPSTTRT